jgi:hypothetical protein
MYNSKKNYSRSNIKSHILTVGKVFDGGALSVDVPNGVGAKHTSDLKDLGIEDVNFL